MSTRKKRGYTDMVHTMADESNISNKQQNKRERSVKSEENSTRKQEQAFRTDIQNIREEQAKALIQNVAEKVTKPRQTKPKVVRAATPKGPSATTSKGNRGKTSLNCEWKSAAEELANMWKNITPRPPQVQLQLENLIAYDLSNQPDVSLQTKSILAIVDKCVKILTRLINNTDERIVGSQALTLPPFGSDYDIYGQYDVFCKHINKDNTVVSYEDGTARTQGLFFVPDIEMTSSEQISTLPINNLLDLNKLCNRERETKISIQASEGNPNGVLATALYQTLLYLNDSSDETDKDTKDKLSGWCVQVKNIFNASRNQTGDDEGATDKFNDTVNAILEKLMSLSSIKSSSPNELLLSTLIKIYGSFLNKGLSDISQAGELAKFYVLKYLQEAKGKISVTRTSYSTGEVLDELKDGNIFWQITSGLPFLGAYSSDTIASALGVRIQNLFKGQFQSILPRKHSNGNFLVLYIPYKYMSFINLLTIPHICPPNNLQRVSQKEKKEHFMYHFLQDQYGREKYSFTNTDDIDIAFGIFDQINTIKCNFISHINSIPPSLGRSDIFGETFLNGLRVLTHKIYSFYKIFLLKDETDFFYMNISTIINEITSKVPNSFSDDEVAELISILSFEDTYTRVYSDIVKEGLYLTDIQVIQESFNYIKSILFYFGSMIQKLHKIFNDNIDFLTNLWEKNSVDGIHEFPSWAGILYSTISYYDNCYDFHNKSKDDLLKLYLQISQMEISCAIQDVDMGHDQKAKSIETLGLRFARDYLKQSQNEIDLRRGSHISDSEEEQQTKRKASSDSGHGKKEKKFSKFLIQSEGMKYCSVALAYNREHKPILATVKTGNYQEDLMFNTELAIPDATGIVNNFTPIGPGEVCVSIDYIKGRVASLSQSRAGLKYDFNSYNALVKYIISQDVIELRFPTTNFDAAAPSGCVYKNVGNQSVSFYTTTVNTKDREPGTYIYVILTTDLNQDDYENNLTPSLKKCNSSVAPRDIFNISYNNTSTENAKTLKQNAINFTKSIPEKDARNYASQLFKKMMALMECYKLPLNPTSSQSPRNSILPILMAQYSDVNFNSILRNIKDKLDYLKDAHTESLQKGKKASGEGKFKSKVGEYFEFIVSELGNYYNKQCFKNIDVAGCDPKIEQAISNIILNMDICMGNNMLKTTAKGTVTRTQPYNLSDSEREADAAKGLLGMLSRKSREPTTESSQQISRNKSINITQLSDEERLRLAEKEAQEQEEEEKVIKTIMEMYSIDNVRASNLYDKTKIYVISNFKKWLGDYDAESQTIIVDDYIQNIENPTLRLKGDTNLLIKKTVGGQRKLKKMNKISQTRSLHKKYKNKVTKRRNKRVRKTKKRHIKGKRITRRR
jgi:hypothetical protein